MSETSSFLESAEPVPSRLAIAAGRTAFAWESVLRLGTATPIDVQSVSFASQMELSDSVFDTWQQGIAATWLFGENARLRTPWAFAASAMNCAGMLEYSQFPVVLVLDRRNNSMKMPRLREKQEVDGSAEGVIT